MRSPRSTLELGVRDTRDIKPIGRTTINRWRAQASDGREIVDLQTWTQQMIGNMEHDDFADKQHVCAERLRAEQLAFETGLRLLHARRLDVNRGCGVQLCCIEFALLRRKVCRRNIHGVEQVLGHHVHDELAASLNVSRSILRFALIVLADTDNDIQRITADRVEKAERCEVDDAAWALAGDPCDRTGY